MVVGLRTLGALAGVEDELPPFPLQGCDNLRRSSS